MMADAVRPLRHAALALALATPLAAASPAAAVDLTEIVDSYAPASPFAFHASLGVDWQWRQRRGPIRREFTCIAHETLGGASLCPDGSRVLLADELRVERTTSTLNVDARLGLGRVLELRLGLPVVLYARHQLRFAPGVDEGQSLTDPYNQPSLFDVPFTAAERAGLGDPRVGLRVAPLSGARDPLEPSWVLGAALDLPWGSVRRADNTDVGEGVWRLTLSSALSTRVFRWLEPFFSLDGALAFASADSVYRDGGRVETVSGPAHRVGVRFGAELVPFENPTTRSAVRLVLGGKVDVVFDGRGYSDLADALGTSACDPSASDEPCGLTTYDRGDIDPRTGAPRKTDGVTTIEHHLVVGGWLGVRYEVFEALELRATASVARESDHFITFSDVGVDLDGQNDVEALNASGQNEISPTWLGSVDTPGHRFRTGGIWILGIDIAMRAKF